MGVAAGDVVVADAEGCSCSSAGADEARTSLNLNLIGQSSYR